MKIYQIRKKKGMTQDELAKASGTTQQQIAKIEKDLVDPKLSTLRKIAKALNCEVQALLWSKADFLRELNWVVKKHGLVNKNTGIRILNSLCALEKKIQPYHPFWEELEIKNGKLKFKEEMKK